MCVLCVVRVYVRTSDCECMCCRLSPSEPISFQAKTFLKFFPFALKTIQNYTIVNSDAVVVCFTFSAVKNGTIVVFTARQRSFGNVLFSVVSVCLFVCVWGGAAPCTEPRFSTSCVQGLTHCTRSWPWPPSQTCLNLFNLGLTVHGQPPSPLPNTCKLWGTDCRLAGGFTFYWNAFLLHYISFDTFSSESPSIT